MYEQYEPPKVYESLSILNDNLPTVRDALVTHLEALLRLQLVVAGDLATWQELLYVKRKQLLWPKDVDKKTELDRNTYLNAGFLCRRTSDGTALSEQGRLEKLADKTGLLIWVLSIFLSY